MERDISIQRTKETCCSCNSCGAQNYASALSSSEVKQAEPIYEVRVGIMCNRLCRDCLNALVKNVAVVLGAEFGR